MNRGATQAVESISKGTQVRTSRARRTATIWRTKGPDSKGHYGELPPKTITYTVKGGQVISCHPTCYAFAAEFIEANNVRPGENFTTHCKSMGLTMHFHLDRLGDC